MVVLDHWKNKKVEEGLVMDYFLRFASAEMVKNMMLILLLFGLLYLYEYFAKKTFISYFWHKWDKKEKNEYARNIWLMAGWMFPCWILSIFVMIAIIVGLVFYNISTNFLFAGNILVCLLKTPTYTREAMLKCYGKKFKEKWSYDSLQEF